MDNGPCEELLLLRDSVTNNYDNYNYNLLPLSILIIRDNKSLATVLGSRTLSVHLLPEFKITGSEEGHRTSINKRKILKQLKVQHGLDNTLH